MPNFTFDFQKGVRGLAFHPDFNTPSTDGFRKFYTAHSRTAFAGGIDGGVVGPKFFNAPFPPGVDLIRSLANGPSMLMAPSIRRATEKLIRIGQPADDHNVGSIGFNPNANSGDVDYGNLYIALGDGGGGGDPNNLAQDISTSVSVAATKAFLMARSCV